MTTDIEPPSIVGMGTDPKENLKVYDEWASRYEKDIRSWGYELPERVAKALPSHLSTASPADCKVLDAGAGDGLSGIALKEQGFLHIEANDLSPNMLQIAKTRNCYEKLRVVDMKQVPLPYPDDSFDVVTCVGTVTYLDPTVLAEFVRITRTGGLVIYTNRTDKLDKWKEAEDLQQQWKVVHISDPIPYLPGNAEYGDKVQVTIRLFRVEK